MCKPATTKPPRRTQGMNWIRKDKRLAIYLRDGMACVYCGRGVEDGAQLTLPCETRVRMLGRASASAGQIRLVRQSEGWLDIDTGRPVRPDGMEDGRVVLRHVHDDLDGSEMLSAHRTLVDPGGAAEYGIWRPAEQSRG